MEIKKLYYEKLKFRPFNLHVAIIYVKKTDINYICYTTRIPEMLGFQITLANILFTIKHNKCLN